MVSTLALALAAGAIASILLALVLPQTRRAVHAAIERKALQLRRRLLRHRSVRRVPPRDLPRPVPPPAARMQPPAAAPAPAPRPAPVPFPPAPTEPGLAALVERATQHADAPQPSQVPSLVPVPPLVSATTASELLVEEVWQEPPTDPDAKPQAGIPLGHVAAERIVPEPAPPAPDPPAEPSPDTLEDATRRLALAIDESWDRAEVVTPRGGLGRRVERSGTEDE